MNIPAILAGSAVLALLLAYLVAVLPATPTDRTVAAVFALVALAIVLLLTTVIVESLAHVGGGGYG